MATKTQVTKALAALGVELQESWGRNDYFDLLAPEGKRWVCTRTASLGYEYAAWHYDSKSEFWAIMLDDVMCGLEDGESE